MKHNWKIDTVKHTEGGASGWFTCTACERTLIFACNKGVEIAPDPKFQDEHLHPCKGKPMNASPGSRS